MERCAQSYSTAQTYSGASLNGNENVIGEAGV
jgi:hypothetical protein